MRGGGAIGGDGSDGGDGGAGGCRGGRGGAMGAGVGVGGGWPRRGRGWGGRGGGRLAQPVRGRLEGVAYRRRLHQLAPRTRHRLGPPRLLRLLLPPALGLGLRLSAHPLEIASDPCVLGGERRPLLVVEALVHGEARALDASSSGATAHAATCAAACTYAYAIDGGGRGGRGVTDRWRSPGGARLPWRLMLLLILLLLLLWRRPRRRRRLLVLVPLLLAIVPLLLLLRLELLLLLLELLAVEPLLQKIAVGAERCQVRLRPRNRLVAQQVGQAHWSSPER